MKKYYKKFLNNVLNKEWKPLQDTFIPTCYNVFKEGAHPYGIYQYLVHGLQKEYGEQEGSDEDFNKLIIHCIAIAQLELFCDAHDVKIDNRADYSNWVNIQATINRKIIWDIENSVVSTSSENFGTSKNPIPALGLQGVFTYIHRLRYQSAPVFIERVSDETSPVVSVNLILSNGTTKLLHFHIYHKQTSKVASDGFTLSHVQSDVIRQMMKIGLQRGVLISDMDISELADIYRNEISDFQNVTKITEDWVKKNLKRQLMENLSIVLTHDVKNKIVSLDLHLIQDNQDILSFVLGSIETADELKEITRKMACWFPDWIIETQTYS